MAERLVVNTGPLIALHRAEALAVVGQLRPRRRRAGCQGVPALPPGPLVLVPRLRRMRAWYANCCGPGMERRRGPLLTGMVTARLLVACGGVSTAASGTGGAGGNGVGG